MRALVSAVLVCSIVALLLVVGCTDILSKQKVGGFGDVSKTTGSGSGTSVGTSGGKSGGSGSGSSPGADDELRKAYFTVDCTMTRVDGPESRTVKIKGDVPLSIIKNWDKKPYIDSVTFYEDAGKLDVYSEWNHICTTGDCYPCHFIYEGPVDILDSIRHEPQDAPSDWKATILSGVSAGETTKLVQYTKNEEPSCPVSTKEATGMLIAALGSCFEQANKPFTLSDGSKITWTSTEPTVTLDSTAVFHFSN